MFTRENLIKRWSHSTYDGWIYVKLYDLGKHDEYGKWILGYTLQSGKDVIFSGEDYHVAPSVQIDSVQAVYGLLGFLTLQAGDTDDEFFENYTQKQLDWTQSSQCEDLAYFVMEQEEKQERRNRKR